MNSFLKRIEKINTDKQNQVEELLAIIKKAKDIKTINYTMFFLVDNYKADSIFPLLMKLIKNEKYKNTNRSLVYLCGEYSLYECSKEVDFFIELVCTYDGEVGMTAFGILFDSSSLIEYTTENINRWLEMLIEGNRKSPTNTYIIQAIKWLKDD